MHNLLHSVAELTALVEIAHFFREQCSKEFRQTLKLSQHRKKMSFLQESSRLPTPLKRECLT